MPLIKRHIFVPLILLLIQLMTLPSAVGEEQEDYSKEEDWYQIEYVLFEHQTGDRRELRYEALPHFRYYSTADHETYQHFFEEPYFEPGKALVENHFSPIENNKAVLFNAYQHLRKDRRARVFHFRGWQQSIHNETKSYPLLIDQRLDDGWHLNGTATIRRERYLHFDIDVTLFKKQWFEKVSWLDWVQQDPMPLSRLLLPVSEDPLPSLPFSHAGNLEWLALERVHLKDSRRVKDEERHYIDHPALGVIVTIKKVASPFSLDVSLPP